jgi:hypothetical protein
MSDIGGQGLGAMLVFLCLAGISVIGFLISLMAVLGFKKTTVKTFLIGWLSTAIISFLCMAAVEVSHDLNFLSRFDSLSLPMALILLFLTFYFGIKALGKNHR